MRNATMKKCFEFDFIEDDKNPKIKEAKIPKFTEKNLALINVFLKYNSSYSAAENMEEGSYSKIISENREGFFEFKKPHPPKKDVNIDGDGNKKAKKVEVDEEGNEKTILYKVIESIDTINSTHLASEGRGDGSENEIDKEGKKEKKNKGRVRTERVIREEITGAKLKERLSEGDADLINQIARAGGKYNFSFATKFCTYVSKYIFGEKHNEYCIYDNVVQSVLPFYISYYIEPKDMSEYCHRKTRGNGKGNIVSDIDEYIKSDVNNNEKDYEKYKTIIKNIIKGIKKKDNITINYEQFDHLLWYYFKGSESKIQTAMNTIKLPDKKQKTK